jgi:pimeloyl-ACP methyl ester carboxylesterase
MATAALNWYPSLAYLGQRFRVVAPNLRGHGREGCGAPPFSLEGCSDDLAALINELEIRHPIAVGYSMGGALAQVLARRHGDLLGGIVLCATAATFARRVKLRPLVRLTGSVLSKTARAHPEGAASLLRWRLKRHDQAAALRRARVASRSTGDPLDLRTVQAPAARQASLAAGPSSGPGPEQSFEAGAARSGDGAEPEPGAALAVLPASPDRAWAMEERGLSHLAAYVEAGAELNAYDSSAWLAELRLPTAVVVTARDRTVAPWRQEAMAALVPGARRYSVEAGHDAAVTHSDIFLPVLAGACLAVAARGRS